MKNSTPKTKLTENINRNYGTIAAIWATITVLTYCLFSTPTIGENRPIWFQVTTFLLQGVATISAGVVCWRTAVVRGLNSTAWGLFAYGMLFYAIGDAIVLWWQIAWKLNPFGSIGQGGYIIYQVFLTVGMLWVLWRSHLRLPRKQIAIVTLGTFLAAGLAWWVRITPATAAIPPEWVVESSRVMLDWRGHIGLFYLVMDITIATAALYLFAGFFGGRLGLPWLWVGLAAMCDYSGDLWFAYTSSRSSTYTIGFIAEVGWVFCALALGVAASLERQNDLRLKAIVSRQNFR